MALSKYSEVELEFEFEDASSIKMTVGPYATTDSRLSQIKANAMEYNNKPVVPTESLVNKNGATLANVPIKSASIITTNEEVVL